MSKPRRRTGSGRNLLRIVGGSHRRRQIRFPDRPGLRPTPDRVRETLFNWLTGRVRGAVCLDVFAGSGALGLEALSRGAASVWFIERDRIAADMLADNLRLLDLPDGHLLRGEATRQLVEAPWRNGPPVDLLFIDPPFGVAGLDVAVLDLLEGADWLAPDALIYLEYPVARPPAISGHWRVHRQGSAGESAFVLLAVSAPGPGPRGYPGR